MDKQEHNRMLWLYKHLSYDTFLWSCSKIRVWENIYDIILNVKKKGIINLYVQQSPKWLVEIH